MKRNSILMSITAFVLLLTVTTGYNFANEKELPIKRVPNIDNAAEAYFSPDCKTLIGNVQAKGDTHHGVYTINIDGTNLKAIERKGFGACSYWHPNGKSIIWTSTMDHLDLKNQGDFSDPNNYPKGAEIYISDLDGKNVKRLTNNLYYDAEVGYSPNGKIILFSRMIDGKIDLWTMNPDGSNQKQVTHTAELQEGGAFIMPDNETIIYRAWKKSDQGQRGMPMTIYTIKIDGTDRKQITTDPGTNWAPFPAPDGKHFVYIRVLPPHNYEIYLMNIETKKKTRLTYDKGFDGFPVLSPDGKMLCFSSSRGNKRGNRALKWYIMDVSSLNLGKKKK